MPKPLKLPDVPLEIDWAHFKTAIRFAKTSTLIRLLTPDNLIKHLWRRGEYRITVDCAGHPQRELFINALERALELTAAEIDRRIP